MARAQLVSGASIAVVATVALLSSAAQATVTLSGSNPVVVTVDSIATVSPYFELGSVAATAFQHGFVDALLAPLAIAGNVGHSFEVAVPGYEVSFGGFWAPIITITRGFSSGWTGTFNATLTGIQNNVAAFSLNSYTLHHSKDATHPAVDDTTAFLNQPSRNVTVPLPVAGAGLPAVLGLMGFGLYRRRHAAR